VLCVDLWFLLSIYKIRYKALSILACLRNFRMGLFQDTAPGWLSKRLEKRPPWFLVRSCTRESLLRDVNTRVFRLRGSTFSILILK
jgi:hypothetical protein